MGALQFVQRAPLGDGQQSQRSFGCAGLLLGLGRGQRPLTPERRIDRYAVARSRKAAAAAIPARLCPAGRALELRRDLVVRLKGRLGSVPGAAIGINLPIGRLCQRAVRASSVFQGCRPVDGGANQRMPKAHVGPNLQEAIRLGGRRSPDADAEEGRRSPQQRCVAGRLCHREQQQLLRLAREPLDPSPEALLDLPR